MGEPPSGAYRARALAVLQAAGAEASSPGGAAVRSEGGK